MPIFPYDYQTVDRTPKPIDGLTDLAVMGVPPEYRDGSPEPDAYPIKFSDEGYGVWIDMLAGEEYEVKTRGQTLDGVWHTAIQLFLRMCQDFGVSPFSGSTDITENEAVLYAVRKHRIQLVQFVDEFEIFKKLEIRVAYREYVRTSDGFIISSWAEMYPYKAETRPEFEAWLNNIHIHRRRFQRYVDNHFVVVIAPGLQCWFKTINLLRLHMGFTIKVDGTINIPGNPNPSRKEVDAWLDRWLWIPLIRSHKFEGVDKRLF
jgi:hypothetical protein